MLAAISTGFFTSFSLILAIGAQNAFVLRQGLNRSHVLAVVLICAISDALLIVLGILGFGALTSQMPLLPIILTVAGAGFLFVYGAMRFLAAWRGHYHIENGKVLTRRAAILATLGFTWLNPHVYLDTFGLIGAISTGFVAAPEKIAFGAGAISASFVFFFSLGYGAANLSGLFNSERAWRVMDTVIGIVMWALAAQLLLLH